ncbi:formate/nitrite transporter FocA (FNT family) [Bradyrhizobium sp. GM24.11]
MIVLLSLELVTGSFAIVPLARLEGKASWNAVIANWSWVFVANLLGSLAFGALIAIALTNMGKVEVAGVAARIVAVAEAKTIGNAAIGTAGMVSVFVKAILCNWLVCLGVVMAMTSTSTVGKIAATWLPIFLFFALGFEHSRRQHVRHPDRHAAGRQGQPLRLVAVESDPRDARQSRRRLRLHRPRALRHVQARKARGRRRAGRGPGSRVGPFSP